MIGKATMVTPSANITPAGVVPRLKRFTVTGIFKVGFHRLQYVSLSRTFIF